MHRSVMRIHWIIWVLFSNLGILVSGYPKIGYLGHCFLFFQLKVRDRAHTLVSPKCFRTGKFMTGFEEVNYKSPRSQCASF